MSEPRADRAASPYKLDSCRFTNEDLQRIAFMRSSRRYSIQEVYKRREASRSAPPPPSAQMKLALSHRPCFVRPRVAFAPWVGEVCRQRSHFHKCAFWLQRSGGGGEVFLAFSFALQSPIVLGSQR